MYAEKVDQMKILLKCFENPSFLTTYKSMKSIEDINRLFNLELSFDNLLSKYISDITIGLQLWEELHLEENPSIGDTKMNLAYSFVFIDDNQKNVKKVYDLIQFFKREFHNS